MTTSGILVSVLVPSYNHARFIRQAIESVWSQSLRDIELIIVDDNSSDESFEIAWHLSLGSPVDMRVLKHERNRGCGAALNSALAIARGQWIATLASDDFYAPMKLERQLALAHQMGSNYGCVHSDAYMVDEHGRILGRTYDRSAHPPMRENAFIEFAKAKSRVVAISAIARADIVRQIGGFDESMAAEDFDYHLRLSQHTRYAFVEEPLCYTRQLKGSLGRRPDRFVESTVRAIKRQHDSLGEHFDSALRATYSAAALAYASVPDWREFAHFAGLAARQSGSLSELLSTARHLSVSAATSIGQRHIASKLPDEFRKRLGQVARRLLF